MECENARTRLSISHFHTGLHVPGPDNRRRRYDRAATPSVGVRDGGWRLRSQLFSDKMVF